MTNTEDTVRGIDFALLQSLWDGSQHALGAGRTRVLNQLQALFQSVLVDVMNCPKSRENELTTEVMWLLESGRTESVAGAVAIYQGWED